jgi:uroporphyrinogen-III decarboxylase
MDELLMSVVEDPEELMSALSHLLKGQKAYIDCINDAGLKPILFESGTTPPLLPVKAFVEIEAPLLKELFTHTKQLFGQFPPCIIGGDAAQIVEPFLETNPSWVIAPSETDQSAFLNTAMRYPGIHVRVNMSAQVLLSQSSECLRSEVERVTILARTRPNTSVGCGVVPFETDPETLLSIKSLIETKI